MKRKQRKSQQGRRFGYVILTIIKFGEICFEFLKELSMRLLFSTHFSVFGYLMKHSSLCLKYYMKMKKRSQTRSNH